MAIPVIKPPREEVLKCIARFKDLKGTSDGLPDMGVEGYHRTFYSVLGFEAPVGDAQFSPFGDAVKPKVGHLQTGFGLAFVKCKPGQGVFMHVHDTYETFMVMDGKWKLEWEGDAGVETVFLEPLDFIAFPIGVQRRFECAEAPAGKEEGTLLGIIAGDHPAAEYSPEAVKALASHGITVQ